MILWGTDLGLGWWVLMAVNSFLLSDWGLREVGGGLGSVFLWNWDRFFFWEWVSVMVEGFFGGKLGSLFFSRVGFWSGWAAGGL